MSAFTEGGGVASTRRSNSSASIFASFEACSSCFLESPAFLPNADRPEPVPPGGERSVRSPDLDWTCLSSSPARRIARSRASYLEALTVGRQLGCVAGARAWRPSAHPTSRTVAPEMSTPPRSRTRRHRAYRTSTDVLRPRPTSRFNHGDVPGEAGSGYRAVAFRCAEGETALLVVAQ